jgi:hypothetical protein
MRTIVSVGYGGRPLRTHRPRHEAIDLGGQRSKVDVRLDLRERVAELIDLLAVLLVSEQVGLDGAARFHRGQVRQGSGRRNFTKDRWGEVFRGPL